MLPDTGLSSDQVPPGSAEVLLGSTLHDSTLGPEMDFRISLGIRSESAHPCSSCPCECYVEGRPKAALYPAPCCLELCIEVGVIGIQLPP